MRGLAVLFLLIPAGAALADGPPAACQTQRTTDDMAACALFRQGEAELALGLALADLRGRFPETSAMLDAAQADWAMYRDSHCWYLAYRQGGAPGSESLLDDLACKTDLTLRRAEDLRALLDL